MLLNTEFDNPPPPHPAPHMTCMVVLRILLDNLHDIVWKHSDWRIINYNTPVPHKEFIHVLHAQDIDTFVIVFTLFLKLEVIRYGLCHCSLNRLR